MDAPKEKFHELFSNGVRAPLVRRRQGRTEGAGESDCLRVPVCVYFLVTNLDVFVVVPRQDNMREKVHFSDFMLICMSSKSQPQKNNEF